ncbi:unnamed protein product, partial [Adineta steineri]
RSPNNNNNMNINRRHFIPNLPGNMMMDEGDLSDDAAMN